MMNRKKLGFGLMRLPLNDPADAAKVDYDTLCKMADRYMEQGFNYFDTAYTYGGSEACLGAFLAKGYRDQVNIATKLPHYYVKEAGDPERYFKEQLERLKTDHIEYYLMHMLNDVSAWERLKSLGIPLEAHVMSAHRTPEEAAEFSKNALQNGFGVIIAAAGKAAHLAGVLAAHTTLPVIGIPVKSSTLDGLDALLATVQMPSGIPVATVAIDGADNAAILAAQMLALSDPALQGKLSDLKREMREGVAKKDQTLQEKLKEL